MTSRLRPEDLRRLPGLDNGSTELIDYRLYHVRKNPTGRERYFNQSISSLVDLHVTNLHMPSQLPAGHMAAIKAITIEYFPEERHSSYCELRIANRIEDSFNFTKPVYRREYDLFPFLPSNMLFALDLDIDSVFHTEIVRGCPSCGAPPEKGHGDTCPYCKRRVFNAGLLVGMSQAMVTLECYLLRPCC